MTMTTIQKKKVLFIALALMSVSDLFAQNLVNHGATISVQPETVFSTGFGFTNNGTVTNNGALMVGGTWMNNGIYNEADGEVIFSSSEPQIINHNSQSFTKLKIVGGGIKTFEADLTIKEELVLTNGILQSANDAQLKIDHQATVSGGSSQSYIEGTIVHRGIGSKYFPLGTDNAFLPVELMNVIGEDPEIAFSVVVPNPNISFDGSLNDVSPNQYWQMEVLSGNFGGSLINLAINDEGFLPDIVNATVAHAPDLNTPFTSLGQSTVTGSLFEGRVLSDIVGSGPIFTVGFAPAVPANASINVITALSPNGDGLHDFLKIINIAAFPNNRLTIFDRWGNRVFEVRGYDNVNNVFEGFANTNGQKELIDGTYFYVLDKGNGKKAKSGFIEMRR